MVWARTQEWGVSGEHTSPRFFRGMCDVEFSNWLFPTVMSLSSQNRQTSSSPSISLGSWSPPLQQMSDCRKSNSKTRQTVPRSQVYDLQPRTSRTWMLINPRNCHALARLEASFNGVNTCVYCRLSQKPKAVEFTDQQGSYFCCFARWLWGADHMTF